MKIFLKQIILWIIYPIPSACSKQRLENLIVLLPLHISVGLFIITSVLSVVKAGNSFSFNSLSLENKTGCKGNRDELEWPTQ